MANFHLNKIHIQNFRSIKNVDLEIKDGLYAIIGKNKDQPASFNGAGKSSCVYALWWCITGTSLGGEVLADDVVNIQEGKDCRVECTFDADQGEITIMRCRKDKEHGNNLFLTINGQDLSCHKIVETQERINQLLKVNFDVLKSTIIMTADMKSRFSELTPQNRVSLLESIRDYTIWEKVRAESNIDIKDLEQKIKNNNADANQLQGSVNTYNNLIIELRQRYIEERNKVNNENTEEKLKTLQNDLDALKKQKADLENINYDEQNSAIDLQIKSINEKIEKYDIKYKTDETDVRDKYKKSNSEIKSTIPELEQQIKNLSQQTMNIDFDIKNIQFEIDTIQKWFTNDVCPTCNRKLDRTQEEIADKNTKKDELSSKIKEKEAEKEELVKKSAAVELTKKQYEEKIENNEKKSEEECKILLEKYIQDTFDLKKEIEGLKEKQENIKQNEKETKTKINYLIDEINKLQSQILLLSEQNKSVEEKLQEIQKQAEDYKKQVEELNKNKEEFIKENEKLEKQKQYVKFFYDSLGPKGNFRGVLLARDIAYINECIKNYTPKFFSGANLYLTTPSMDKNVIDIVFEEDGVIKPVSNLSGGERKRVDLEIQMAIYDLVQSTSLFNFNLCVFDEIESALDPEGVRQLLEVIDDRQDNFQTAWWITNNEMVSSNIPNRLVAVKNHGFTKVEYEQ